MSKQKIESCKINKHFKAVSSMLLFNYGLLGEIEGGDGTNKGKMKKRNLRAALKKGYIWGSYRNLSFTEWCEKNGYTAEYCKSEGIYKNALYNSKNIDINYEKYRTDFYRGNKQINEKLSEIQNFILISDLLEENKSLKLEIAKMSVKTPSLAESVHDPVNPS